MVAASLPRRFPIADLKDRIDDFTYAIAVLEIGVPQRYYPRPIFRGHRPIRQ